MTQNRIEGKFYPLTPSTGKKLREAKLTAAEWRVWSYLVELDPFGDRYVEIETLEVMQECDCSKSTFYKALGKFQALELFDFQDLGIFARNLAIPKNRKRVRKIGNESEKSESCPRNRKRVRKIGNESEKSESCASKTAPADKSESPQTIQTYSDFKDSLSDSEREKFFDFVREQIKNLPQSVNDLEAWLASQNKTGQNRWFVYYQNFSAAKVSQPTPKSQIQAAAASVRHQFQAELEQRRQAAQLAWEQSQIPLNDHD